MDSMFFGSLGPIRQMLSKDAKDAIFNQTAAAKNKRRSAFTDRLPREKDDRSAWLSTNRA